MSSRVEANVVSQPPAVSLLLAADGDGDDRYRLLSLRWRQYAADFPPLALPSLLEALLFEDMADRDSRPEPASRIDPQLTPD